MKKMKKLLFMTALIFGAFGMAQGQSIDFGLNGGLTLPFGDISEAGVGFAWTGHATYHATDELNFGLEYGSRAFTRSESFGGLTFESTIVFANFLGVANYNFLSDGDITLGAGLGAGIFTSSIRDVDGSGQTDFGISPRISGTYLLTDNIGLSAAIPFNMVFSEGSTTTFAELRVGAFYRLEL